jgi:AraC-like DNA-binding protein
MFHDLPLKAVIAHVEMHLNETLDVEALSRLTGYAPGYFRRVFLSAIGTTPALYVRKRRISHAAFQIRNTRQSITDIAMQHGFTSTDAFARAFRKLTGQSPVDFRKSDRTVKGVMLIPGLLAPILVDRQTMKENHHTHKEGQHMNQSDNFLSPTGVHERNTSVSPDGSAVLYGVPKVSYFNSPPELTPFIASLRACLTFSGQTMPYDRLLSASGAAFRLMWNTRCLDGGNVDILVMRPDPFEPIRRAFQAAGRTFSHIMKNAEPGNREAMITLLRSELDAGRPVIAFGIVGPPEACVLTGYQADGEVVLGWNFFQDFPEWQGSIQKHEAGYFIRRGWYEHPDTLGIMAVGPMGDEPEEKDFLLDLIRFALTVMNGPAVGDRANGKEAFDAWEAMLRDDRQFPHGATLPMLMERLMVQGDAFTMVAEGRGYAGSFFLDEAKRFPAHEKRLMEVSGLCRRIHEKAWEMIPFAGGMGMGEEQARSLENRENRLAIADRVRSCRDLDRQLAEKLALLLTELE